ncbi:hypothetical protein D1007_47177 [Hordeum vulgare]|nr:hypothetical protein D1007_47177 [Hordeum vulgare]
MFQSLERRDQCTLGFSCKEGVSSLLMPNDAGYLDFFTRVVERLEVSAKKVGKIIEKECCHLLAQALTQVFSHLLHANPHFDFEAGMPPVPKAPRGALAEAMEDQVGVLSALFIPYEHEEHGGAKERDGNDDDENAASPSP